MASIPPYVIVQVLQFVWPLIVDDLRAQAEKTKTPWDDRGIILVDIILGNIDFGGIEKADRKKLIEYLTTHFLDE